ncbi:MAG: thiol:disulfide interchange protein DsbA/DsbL [Gammaproteobacteria bacterium]|nr:thiol:disulfide interchange protein DsbA/DsbL [Gammaproteobacteria bacterium]
MRFILILSVCLVLLACESGSNTDNEPKSDQTKATQDASAGKKDEAQVQASGEEQSGHDQDGHDHEGHAHSQTSADGKPYKEVEPKDSCVKPTVIEFFAYQCPHCYKVESYAAEWKKNNADKVDFITVPTELGREEYVPFVLSHHAAKKLGVLDKVKPILFAVIHEKKKIETFFDVFEEAGVSREDAEAAMKDFESLRTAMESNYQLMMRYKVTGVPSFLVNYQYMTDISMAGGYDKVMPTVDEMLKQPNSCSTES